MTLPFEPPARPTPLLNSAFRPLTLEDSYPCPLCLGGQVEALLLTDAFACGQCRHIFTAELPHQQVCVSDSPQPIRWHWTGQAWKVIRPTTQAMTQVISWLAVGLIIFPATLVWFGGYLFPPLSPAPGELPFATLWAGLTLIAHSGVVLWLLAVYYQLPVYLAATIRAWKYQYLSPLN
ncbi:MAG: hypothetical protein ACFB0C_24025 [Leptolyngbyaceae cyanobacterium]